MSITKQMRGYLNDWVGECVSGDVQIVDDNAKPIYQDNFFGVLNRVSPDGYEIRSGDRQINFLPEAVYSIDAGGRIVIHIERR